MRFLYDKVNETKKLFSLYCTVCLLLWKHLEAWLLSLIGLFSIKSAQNCENSQLLDASKCFQLTKTVENSENSFLVSITLSSRAQGMWSTI